MGQGEENAVGSHTCLFSTCGSKDYTFSKASCFKSSEVQLTRSVNVLGENNKVPSIFCQKFGGEGGVIVKKGKEQWKRGRNQVEMQSHGYLSLLQPLS